MVLVQLILGLGLFTCLVIALIVFLNLLKNKEGKRIFLKFLGIELAIFILILLFLLFSLKESFGVLIIMSIIYTLFANIPIAIVFKIAEIVVRKRQMPPKP